LVNKGKEKSSTKTNTKDRSRIKEKEDTEIIDVMKDIDIDVDLKGIDLNNINLDKIKDALLNENFTFGDNETANISVQMGGFL